MSSPAPGELSFNQTTDAGDKSQKGFNFAALPAGPNAKFVENTQKAYDTATTDKARENICGSSRSTVKFSPARLSTRPKFPSKYTGKPWTPQSNQLRP